MHTATVTDRQIHAVHCAFPRCDGLPHKEKLITQLVSELCAYGAAHGLRHEDDPDKADLILLLESVHYKTFRYLEALLSDPLLQRHAKRVYTINYDDHPHTMLPGLYTSIDRLHFNPHVHVVWPALFASNPLIYSLSREELFAHRPTRLFSFIGYPSHPLRDQLLKRYTGDTQNWRVVATNKWYNHDTSDYQHFLDVSLDSIFCLCPRGYTAYTHRTAAVMAMGRVPVIIASDWIPFSFPDERPYYVHLDEKDIDRIL